MLDEPSRPAAPPCRLRKPSATRSRSPAAASDMNVLHQLNRASPLMQMGQIGSMATSRGSTTLSRRTFAQDANRAGFRNGTSPPRRSGGYRPVGGIGRANECRAAARQPARRPAASAALSRASWLRSTDTAKSTAGVKLVSDPFRFHYLRGHASLRGGISGASTWSTSHIGRQSLLDPGVKGFPKIVCSDHAGELLAFNLQAFADRGVEAACNRCDDPRRSDR
jgi:hypothetical protein